VRGPQLVDDGLRLGHARLYPVESASMTLL
jgi:hypothetical protein